MTAWDADLEAYLGPREAARLDGFLEFLRIPSISGIPAHAGDCARAASWLADRLGAVGMEHVEVSPTGGHPIVYADWLHAAGAPTVVAYGHYDVQPVDPLDEWTSPPFEPVVVGDRILARGASDDKGNITILVDAVEALLAVRGALPVNLRFVFEGEEESSSVHLEPWLLANRDRLQGDLAIVSDVGFFEGNLPALTVALRLLRAIERAGRADPGGRISARCHPDAAAAASPHIGDLANRIGPRFTLVPDPSLPRDRFDVSSA